MINQFSQNTFNYFVQYLQQQTSIPTIPPTIKQFCFAAYRFKLIDAIWFEPIAPTALDEEFTVFFNDTFPEPDKTPDNFTGILRLGQDELMFLSWRLIEPAWISSVPPVEFTLAEFFEHWKNDTLGNLLSSRD